MARERRTLDGDRDLSGLLGLVSCPPLKGLGLSHHHPISRRLAGFSRLYYMLWVYLINSESDFKIFIFFCPLQIPPYQICTSLVMCIRVFITISGSQLFIRIKLSISYNLRMPMQNPVLDSKAKDESINPRGSTDRLCIISHNILPILKQSRPGVEHESMARSGPTPLLHDLLPFTFYFTMPRHHRNARPVSSVVFGLH